MVVDTPGFFDTRKADDEICTELIRSCALLSPGFHAILLVIKAERHTAENQEAVEKYFKLFGKQADEYMFLVLTHWDLIQEEAESLDNYFRRGNKELQRLKSMCKGGAFTISNKGTTKDRNYEVENIVKMIGANLERLGGKCFSNSIFQQMEWFYNLHDNYTAVSGKVRGMIQRLENYRHHNEALQSSTDEESERLCAKERYDYMHEHSTGRDKLRREITDEENEEKEVKRGFFAKLVRFFRRKFEVLLMSLI